jgi:hypothetical protein
MVILVYLGASFLVSIQPEWFAFIQYVPGEDKSIHFLGAGFLSFMMVTGFPPVVLRNRTYGSYSMLGAATLLITLEEFVQLALPLRTFDLTDLGWSYVGIAAFSLPVIWLRGCKESVL